MGKFQAMEAYLSAHEVVRFKKLAPALQLVTQYLSSVGWKQTDPLKWAEKFLKVKEVEPAGHRFVKGLVAAGKDPRQIGDLYDEFHAILKGVGRKRGKKSGPLKPAAEVQWLERALNNSGTVVERDVPPNQAKGLTGVALLECLVELEERRNILRSVGGKIRTELSNVLKESGKDIAKGDGTTEKSWIWADGLDEWKEPSSEQDVGELEAQAMYHEDVGRLLKLLDSLEHNRLTWIDPEVKQASDAIVARPVFQAIRELGKVRYNHHDVTGMNE
jgi:hypothetical protein